jgi:hypothetical protein
MGVYSGGCSIQLSNIFSMPGEESKLVHREESKLVHERSNLSSPLCNPFPRTSDWIDADSRLMFVSRTCFIRHLIERGPVTSGSSESELNWGAMNQENKVSEYFIIFCRSTQSSM